MLGLGPSIHWAEFVPLLAFGFAIIALVVALVLLERTTR